MNQLAPTIPFALACVAVLCGCGSDTERYIPPGEKARSAVEAALSAWKSGEPHGTITSHEPPVDLYDARRQAGQKLEDFKIVEEIPGDPHPSFRVSTRLDGKDGEATYLVMGIDPLLVFRAEDYKRTTGM